MNGDKKPGERFHKSEMEPSLDPRLGNHHHEHINTIQNDTLLENDENFVNTPPSYIDSTWAQTMFMGPNDMYNVNYTETGDPRNETYNQNPHNPHNTQNPTISTHLNTNLHDNSHITRPRRPCDHCRKKKTKCVIVPNTSVCVQCEAKSIPCTFIGLAPKRKLNEEEEARKRSRKNKLSVVSPHSGGLAEIVPPNVPIRETAPVHDYSRINNSLLKKTLSLQFPRSSFYVGPTSFMFDTNLLNLIIGSQNKDNSKSAKVEQINLSDTMSLRKVSEKAQFVLRDDQSPQSYQTMSNDVDTIEKFVAPHGQILIDLYFRIIHPSYPILHKKVFLEKYSRTHREFSAPLLAAVYVLAIQWWDYDPLLNLFPKPSTDTILKIGMSNYLFEILKRPKLSAVQAGLLLLQCRHVVLRPGEEPNKAFGTIGDTGCNEWVLCCQVVAIAEELGLGLNCNNWKLPKWERGLRKRLAWAVYMEDKWLSLKHSRPSHIHPHNWVVVPLIEEDFPEKHGDGDLKEGSSDIDNGKKIFMSLINLSQILSQILDEFYCMTAMQEIKEVTQVLLRAKPLQLQLRNWYHSLPNELQMNTVQPRKLSSNGYLQLAYFAAELTLHRKILTIIYQQESEGNPASLELVQVCRTAARTRLMASIEFVRDLKPEHIHSFWHSSSALSLTLIGIFAALLFMSSSGQEEADFYRDLIFNYRWILKISSKSFEQASDALQHLDLVLQHVPGLLTDNADLPMVVPIVGDKQPSFNNSNVNTDSESLSSFSQGNSQPYPMNQSQESASRGGLYVVNSPQSSQSLSPKDFTKSATRINSDGSGGHSPIKTNYRGPKQENIIKSPETQYTPSGLLNHIETREGSEVG